MKNIIIEFVGFLLSQESKQIKKQAKKTYNYSKVLEINKKIVAGDFDFDYLFELTNCEDKLVREISVIYLSYFYSKNIMSHIFRKCEEPSQLLNFIRKKMSQELKSKICLNLNADKEFIKIIKSDKIFSGSLVGDINISVGLKKLLGKTFVRKLNLNSKSKIDFICNNFKTSKIPDSISYLFVEKVQNLELDELILKLRKQEVFGKKWIDNRAINCDNKINELIQKDYVKNWNIVYKCEKNSFFI